MVDDMPTASVTELRRDTQRLLKKAEHHPVLITRYGKPAFVLMSVAHFEALSKSGGHGP